MIQETFPIIVGGVEVLNERILLTQVENGLLMNGADSVRFIVIHCSATRCDRDYTVEQLLRNHKARGFRTIGYHFYIRKNGAVTQHRKLLEVGAHAVVSIGAASVSVMREGWTNMAIQQTPVHRYRKRLYLSYCISSISFSHKH